MAVWQILHYILYPLILHFVFLLDMTFQWQNSVYLKHFDYCHFTSKQQILFYFATVDMSIAFSEQFSVNLKMVYIIFGITHLEWRLQTLGHWIRPSYVKSLGFCLVIHWTHVNTFYKRISNIRVKSMRQLKLTKSNVNQSVIAETHKNGVLFSRKKWSPVCYLIPLLCSMSKKQRAISGSITHPINCTDQNWYVYLFCGRLQGLDST